MFPHAFTVSVSKEETGHDVHYVFLFTVPFRAIGRAGKYNVDDDLAKIQDFDEGCKFRTSLIKLAPFIPRSIFARYREI